MSFPHFIFRAIDYLFYLPQNAHSFPGISVKKNVVYDEGFPKVCAIDLYRHADRKNAKLPTIVNIHGGGYLGGARQYRSGIAKYYVDKCDVCFINVGYRLCEKFPFPQYMRDAMNALSFIVDHADELNVDLDNLYLMGDSAGAQIAAHMVAVLGNKKLATALECARPNVKIRGAMLFCGPYDLLSAMDKRMPFDFARRIGTRVTGVNLSKENAIESYKYLDTISPVNWVNEKFCPSFICHTKYDVFCAGQSEKLMEKLDKFAIPYAEYKSTKMLDYHCWYLSQTGKSACGALLASVQWLRDAMRQSVIDLTQVSFGSNVAKTSQRTAKNATEKGKMSENGTDAAAAKANAANAKNPQPTSLLKGTEDATGFAKPQD